MRSGRRRQRAARPARGERAGTPASASRYDEQTLFVAISATSVVLRAEARAGERRLSTPAARRARDALPSMSMPNH